MRNQRESIYFIKRIAKVCFFLTLLLGVKPLSALGLTLGKIHSSSTLSKPLNSDFFILSDIHFDTFASPELIDSLADAPVQRWKKILSSASANVALSHYGSDTNYALFGACLEQMKKNNPHPAFIIITGDFLGHDLLSKLQKNAGRDPVAVSSFFEKAFQFINTEIISRFPATPVFPVLGNNDTPYGDYQLDYTSGFLKKLGRIWLPLLRNGRQTSLFTSSFGSGGYYSVPDPGNPANRIIVLNTMPFSAYFHDKDNSKSFAQAGKELLWLKRELQKSRAMQRHVWLVYHIPPGVDPFKSSRTNICHDGPRMYWQSDLNDEFLKLIYQYRDIVKVQIAGHTHMDGFKVMVDETQKPYSYVHLSPALSPLFGNNPAFQEVTYNSATAMLTDYDSWFLDLTNIPGSLVWKMEYSFNQLYGNQGVDAVGLNKVYRKIESDSEVRRRFIRSYNVSSPATQIDTVNFYAYWCGIGLLQKNGYTRCFCSTHKP